jgi:outer membrane protein assembly factor BamD (BamD/ComL family)
MIPFLLLGGARVHFDHENFAAAVGVLDTILRDHSGSGAAPEAVFLKGVCRFKTTHEAKPLKDAYERLSADYPNSDWTKRAYPYRLL